MTRQRRSRVITHLFLSLHARCTFLIATVFLTTVAVTDIFADDSSASYNCAIARLVKHFEGININLMPYLEHPNFLIYKDISEKFKKAPEITARDTYLEERARGDEVTAEKVFIDQYEKYKSRAGFEARKYQIGPFIEKYSTRLTAASEKYGIPQEVIAAVIGVESAFGATTGKYNPFNVFVSMYVADYRSAFALQQLTELVTFVERVGMDVFAMTSSYAGAIGYMQFIPSSLNRWFVGNDVLEMDDNIDSVANYLSYFQKIRGSLEEAVHAYNPSQFYVRLVLDLAEAGKNSIKTQDDALNSSQQNQK